MIGISRKPKYRRMDMVEFEARGERKRGRVYIVDVYGTFEQSEEPSYDILVEKDDCLYKHIKESCLIESLKTEKERKEDLAHLNVEVRERYMRYYYSAEPIIISDKTKIHDVKMWSKISTYVDSIWVKKVDEETKEVLLEYWDQNYQLKRQELKEGMELKVELGTGNPDVSRVSECVLKIVS